MAIVLFSRPNHDVTLGYLFHYSKDLIKISREKGHDTINKEGKSANKSTILSIIKKKKPKLIMLNGHGSPKIVCGQNNEILVNSEDNPEILSQTITYSLSCSSALELGKIAVEKGAICFIGYEWDFAIGKDPESEATPARDKIAKLFLDPSNILFSSLIKGNNVENSIGKAKKKMWENIWYLNTTKEFPEAPHYAPFLFGNYSGLIAHGNKKAIVN